MDVSESTERRLSHAADLLGAAGRNFAELQRSVQRLMLENRRLSKQLTAAGKREVALTQLVARQRRAIVTP